MSNIDTIKEINLSEIFIECHNKYITEDKHLKRWKIQERFQELMNFTNKECYWSRHNTDTDNKGKFYHIEGKMTGKYLNELHNKFLDELYIEIYKKLLKIYFKINEYSSLNTSSIDSSFVRNILGIGANVIPSITTSLVTKLTLS